MIKFHQNVANFISEAAYQDMLAQVRSFISQISSDPMAGWLKLPVDYDQAEFARIKTAAAKIQNDSKYLVCIGIGGSYLGHKALIEALSPKSPTKILYAGNSISPIELQKTLAQLGDADFSVNVISKSGTTTESAIAFRIFKQKLIEKYGAEEAKKRIYATTDQNKGALHDEAQENGYASFVVPDDIGGRYSVLTAVGLLPLATAGVDIDKLMSGARQEMEALLSANGSVAAEYAATRNCLYQQGFTVEVLATFEPAMTYFNEWWKQLFGESEGKDGKGIFPASVVYSTDLHSMGQYMQDGKRQIFETILNCSLPANHSAVSIAVPAMSEDSDGLAYLEGKTLDFVNQKALEATRQAHLDGGVPVLDIDCELSTAGLGALIYFFELSVALSGMALGVDPFNQPGVEAYKNNMFKLLGKPGF